MTSYKDDGAKSIIRNHDSKVSKFDENDKLTDSVILTNPKQDKHKIPRHNQVLKASVRDVWRQLKEKTLHTEKQWRLLVWNYAN